MVLMTYIGFALIVTAVIVDALLIIRIRKRNNQELKGNLLESIISGVAKGVLIVIVIERLNTSDPHSHKPFYIILFFGAMIGLVVTLIIEWTVRKFVNMSRT